MKTIELLNKVVGLGFDREKALADIDASLDEIIGAENRKPITEEEISEELANDILLGFECEKESNIRFDKNGKVKSEDIKNLEKFFSEENLEKFESDEVFAVEATEHIGNGEYKAVGYDFYIGSDVTQGVY